MKNKMRSKVLIFMLCLILSGMAMLGCSNGSEDVDEPELAGVSFGVMEGSDKVIGISYEALSNEDLFWSYTAEWKGGEGVTPEGAQLNKTPIKEGAGFDAELGGFTPGSWEFELFGYSDSERTKLVLSGTSEVVLSAGSTTPVTVVVDYNNTDGTGTIELGEITFKEGTGYTLESITVDNVAKSLDENNQLTGIAAGSHTVYLKYSVTDGGYYEAKVLVTVSAGVTTVIEGELDFLVAAAPTGLAGEKPSCYGQTDGKITGVDTTMEYSKDGGKSWIPVIGTSITGLVAGEYKVRVSGGVRPGTAVDVTVPVGDFRITLCAGRGFGDNTDVYVAAGTDDNFTSVCPSTFAAPDFTPKTGAVLATHENFAGWNTNADGSGTAYAAGSKATISDNTTLYAQWAKPSFSVSATKKVYFSKGNLVATINGSGYPTAWNFATNQYDYLGEGGANKKIGLSSGSVDLFGWSTTTTSNNFGIHTSSYSSGNFKDWGLFIDSLPGNSIVTKVWSTLSDTEWGYLINKDGTTTKYRQDTNRFAKARVNNVNGLLIFPDGYNGGTEISGITGVAKVNTSNANYPDDNIADETWTAMESSGVVFLPAAGVRDYSTVKHAGSHGLYWSRSYFGTNDALFLHFYDDKIYPSDYGSINSGESRYALRNSGLSVRLVCEAKD